MNTGNSEGGGGSKGGKGVRDEKSPTGDNVNYFGWRVHWKSNFTTVQLILITKTTCTPEAIQRKKIKNWDLKKQAIVIKRM